MTNFNWLAMRWAIVWALAFALLYFVFAWSQDEINRASVPITMVLVFVTVLGTAYTILRDAIRSKRQGVVPRDDFGWPRSKLITVGTFALIAAMITGTLVGATLSDGLVLVMSRPGATAEGVGVEALAAMNQLKGFAFISMFVGGIFYLVACIFVGRWIGYKCTSRGFMTVVWTILINRLVLLLLSLSILGYEQYLKTLSEFGLSPWQELLQIPLAVGFALCGYWIGRRRSGSHYLHYLLRSLPKDTNDILLELAYTEATRLENRPEKPNQ